MRRRIASGLAVVFFVASLTVGAAGGPHNSEVAHSQTPTSRHRSKPSKPYQIGAASWYGEYFEGKPTASGEPFSMYGFTAAHPTLPLGTLVKVTNLRNGRSVILRVNDRGPVVDGRIIDVSYNAAKVLGFKAQGLQKVRLDLIPVEAIAMSRPTSPLP